MNTESRQAHRERVYTTKGEKEVSWFQENPAPSLDFGEREPRSATTGPPPSTASSFCAVGRTTCASAGDAERRAGSDSSHRFRLVGLRMWDFPSALNRKTGLSEAETDEG
jgi:hypothetical protein